MICLYVDFFDSKNTGDLSLPEIVRRRRLHASTPQYTHNGDELTGTSRHCSTTGARASSPRRELRGKVSRDATVWCIVWIFELSRFVVQYIRPVVASRWSSDVTSIMSDSHFFVHLKRYQDPAPDETRGIKWSWLGHTPIVEVTIVSLNKRRTGQRKAQRKREREFICQANQWNSIKHNTTYNGRLPENHMPVYAGRLWQSE